MIILLLIIIIIILGDTHSVCFTSIGEIWTWGSNKYGQLGRKLDTLLTINEPIQLHYNSKKYSFNQNQGNFEYNSNNHNHNYIYHINRLDNNDNNNNHNNSDSDNNNDKLWSGEYNFIREDSDIDNQDSKDEDEDKYSDDIINYYGTSLVTDCVIQVCANRCSTIAIIRSNSKNRINNVYQWGCGTYSLIKLKFIKPSVSNYFTERNHNKWSEVYEYANINQISAGLNHFIGIDSVDGYVYSWYQRSNDNTNLTWKLSTPKILENLLPQQLGFYSSSSSPSFFCLCFYNSLN